MIYYREILHTNYSSFYDGDGDGDGCRIGFFLIFSFSFSLCFEVLLIEQKDSNLSHFF